jgi:RNA polymerase sigma-70 factor (ECF subfamily)
MDFGGGRDGFADWYGLEHDRLLTSMTLLLGELEAARDVTSEAFARALAHWERVRMMGNPRGWLYQVALNLVRRSWRRRRLERRAWERVTDRAPPEMVPPERGDLWQAVQALPSRARQAVVLRYVAGFTQAEVAQRMGIAPGTAAATLSAARQRLATQLGRSIKEAIHEPNA